MASKSVNRARSLRQEMTPAEKILWSILRNRRFAGFKFRRQQPIGPFYADFLCAALKLIVELDGETHFGREVQDGRRTSWLAKHGYSVLRVWNPQLYDEREGVLNLIYAECARLQAAQRQG